MGAGLSAAGLITASLAAALFNVSTLTSVPLFAVLLSICMWVFSPAGAPLHRKFILLHAHALLAVKLYSAAVVLCAFLLSLATAASGGQCSWHRALPGLGLPCSFDAGSDWGIFVSLVACFALHIIATISSWRRVWDADSSRFCANDDAAAANEASRVESSTTTTISLAFNSSNLRQSSRVGPHQLRVNTPSSGALPSPLAVSLHESDADDTARPPSAGMQGCIPRMCWYDRAHQFVVALFASQVGLAGACIAYSCWAITYPAACTFFLLVATLWLGATSGYGVNGNSIAESRIVPAMLLYGGVVTMVQYCVALVPKWQLPDLFLPPTNSPPDQSGRIHLDVVSVSSPYELPAVQALFSPAAQFLGASPSTLPEAQFLLQCAALILCALHLKARSSLFAADVRASSMHRGGRRPTLSVTSCNSRLTPTSPPVYAPVSPNAAYISHQNSSVQLLLLGQGKLGVVVALLAKQWVLVTLALLYGLSLSHVDVVHAGYVVFFVWFATQAKHRRDYWPLLVAYCVLAICIMFMWDVTTWALPDTRANIPPWIVGPNIPNPTVDLWHSTFATNMLVFGVAVLQAPLYQAPLRDAARARMREAKESARDFRRQWQHAKFVIAHYSPRLVILICFGICLIPPITFNSVISLSLTFVLALLHLLMSQEQAGDLARHHAGRPNCRCMRSARLFATFSIVEGVILGLRYMYQFESGQEALDNTIGALFRNWMPMRDVGFWRYVDASYNGSVYLQLLDTAALMVVTAVQWHLLVLHHKQHTEDGQRQLTARSMPAVPSGALLTRNTVVIDENDADFRVLPPDSRADAKAAAALGVHTRDATCVAIVGLLVLILCNVAAVSTGYTALASIMSCVAAAMLLALMRAARAPSKLSQAAPPNDGARAGASTRASGPPQGVAGMDAQSEGTSASSHRVLFRAAIAWLRDGCTYLRRAASALTYLIQIVCYQHGGSMLHISVCLVALTFTSATTAAYVGLSVASLALATGASFCQRTATVQHPLAQTEVGRQSHGPRPMCCSLCARRGLARRSSVTEDLLSPHVPGMAPPAQEFSLAWLPLYTLAAIAAVIQYLCLLPFFEPSRFEAAEVDIAAWFGFQHVASPTYSDVWACLCPHVCVMVACIVQRTSQRYGALVRHLSASEAERARASGSSLPQLWTEQASGYGRASATGSKEAGPMLLGPCRWPAARSNAWTCLSTRSR
ncbi:hypothetical protein EON66_01925 [archaeon]|nr:MAG: hypothetical protein EON66_01925 [archaeon]